MAHRSSNSCSSPFLHHAQPDLFEFAVEFRPEMRAADDIFLHGSILPHEFICLSYSTIKNRDARIPSHPRTKSECKGDSENPLGGKEKVVIAQTADYQKLQPWTEKAVLAQTADCQKLQPWRESSATPMKNHKAIQTGKPKRKMSSYRSVSLSEKMETKAMRESWSRRSQSNDSRRPRHDVNTCDSKKSWRLLNFLSCKASVDVTIPTIPLYRKKDIDIR